MEVVPLLAGAVVAALIAPAGLRVLAESPFPAGALVVAAALIALAPLAALQELAGWDLLRPDLFIFGALDEEESIGSIGVYGPIEPDPTVLIAMPLALGAAFLGLLDDLSTGRATRVLEVVGATALALLTFNDYGLPAGEYLLAAAVVVLAMHLFGRIGERPGLSIGAFALLGAGLLIGTWDPDPLRAVGLFAGPLLVLGAYELRHRASLGRTGSNLAGALAGVWVVLALETTGQIVAIVLLVALTAGTQFAGRW
jgi:UDP-GlcNAc:undecaprenyl-phosphate GlcNAc-1-phosphate transferase